MKTKALSTILVLAFATGSIAQAGGIKEIIGRVAGGLFGGALCNEMGIGKGDGRTLAIALCAVGGSMIGGEIGEKMDANDARAFEESQRRSFEGDLNRDYEWNGERYGSRTGIRGVMRPIRQGYHRQTHEVCREYSSVTYRGNRSSQTRTVICRRSNGSFYSLEEKTLFVNGQVVQRDVVEQRGHDRRDQEPAPYITPDRDGGRRLPPPPIGGDRRGGRDSRWDDRRDSRRGDDREYDRDYDSCNDWDIRRLRIGDTVYTRYAERARYSGSNRQGEVLVRVDNFTRTLRIDDIAVEGCHLGMRTGQRVETTSRQSGRLAGVFANGDVAIEMGPFVQILRQRDVFFSSRR